MDIHISCIFFTSSGRISSSRRGLGLKFERISIILVLLELLQLFNVQKRVQIVVHVGDLAYIDGAIAVYDTSAIAVAMVNSARAIAHQAHRPAIIGARRIAIRALVAVIQLVTVSRRRNGSSSRTSRRSIIAVNVNLKKCVKEL